MASVYGHRREEYNNKVIDLKVLIVKPHPHKKSYRHGVYVHTYIINIKQRT